jgi:pyruvate dehydrogenase E1 component alpha subunit
MGVAHPERPDTLRVLDDEGRLRDDAREPALSDDRLRDMYADMLLARRFDRRVVSLNRQGRLGSFPPMYGQEAAQVASVHALAEEDWIVPSYRDHGALVTHGLALENILLYYMGHPAGNAIPDDVNSLPINGSVGSQLLHAMGMAWADVLRGASESVYCCYFGDGATSQGSTQEAWNFAGVFDTPNVFFCQNNGWAISVPRERQTAAETLAQKSHAYGIDGRQVDGMDPLAVYRATSEAVEKARNPGPGEVRPTLIEAVLYRLGAHSTADDPSKYRSEEELKEWKQLDPLPRFEQYLRRTDRLDDDRHEAIETDVENRIEAAVGAAEAVADADPRRMFEHVYADTPDRLRDQAEYLESLRDRHGDETLRGE